MRGTAQPAGSPEANAAFVRELFEAFNAGDTETLLAAMTPDFVMHLAGFPEPLGRDASREGFEMMRRAFPDLVCSDTMSLFRQLTEASAGLTKNRGT